MALSRIQQKFLLDRLQDIRNQKPMVYEEAKLEESIQVREARFAVKRSQIIIDRFNRRKRNLRTKRNEAISKAYLDVRRVILFGDSNNALKALDKFQKKTF